MHVTQVWQRVRAGAYSSARGDRWGVALAAIRGRMPHTLMGRPRPWRSGGVVPTRCSPSDAWLA